MQWQTVESSQIAEVGYGDGLYGPETLGLRFPPNKKQMAAGEPGSEYHYGGVSQEQHRALMDAESVGSYFGKFIKSSPHLYPYTKVEAPDPTQPHSAMIGDQKQESSPSVKDTQSQPTSDSLTDLNGDTLSPSLAMIVIDEMADDLLFTPGKITDAQLATMRSDWLAEAKKYDISTEEKRAELKRFARPLQKLRTGIDARAKELTGKMKRFVAGIDGEKRRLITAVGRIEAEVLAGLTAWEQEEETRKARLAHEVNAFAEAAQVYRYPDTVSLGAAIYELENADLSSMQEYKVSAESAIAASLRVLKPELERRKVAEAERVELERLRAESAARAEADRIAAAAQKLADEQVQARLSAAVEAAKVETRQEVIAEQAVLQDARNTFAAVAEDAKPPTMEEIADDPEEEAPHPSPIPEIPPRLETDLEHRQRFHGEVVEALMGCALTRQEAISVLKAILASRIPHVTISY
jgi:hypothetical protein